MEAVARDCLIDKLPNLFVLQALKNVETYGEYTHAQKTLNQKPNCTRLTKAPEFCFKSVQRRSECNVLARPSPFSHLTQWRVLVHMHKRSQMNGSQMTWEGWGTFCSRHGENKGPNLNYVLQLNSIVCSGSVNGWQLEGEPKGRKDASWWRRWKRGGGGALCGELIRAVQPNWIWSLGILWQSQSVGAVHNGLQRQCCTATKLRCHLREDINICRCVMHLMRLVV